MKPLCIAAILLLLPPMLALAEEPAKDEEGFVPLFNGKDLTGWEGDAKIWHAEDGVLIGRSPGLLYNDFLSTTKSYGDFILRFQILLVKNRGNSGVQFRSKRVPDSHEVSGYQADAANGYWGTLYDEARRNRALVQPDENVIEEAVKPGEWNDYQVTAIGNKITLAINGVTTIEYTEEDPEIPRTGIFATQVHGGPPMEVQFRNLRIKELPQDKPAE